MNRQQLEHIIRASGAITDEQYLVIIGSQALLASYDNPDESLVVSVEADIFPLKEPDKSILIDGCIGELSPFHEQYGYYAHGVGPETATLPGKWRQRLVPLCNENTNGFTGLCLSPIDLVISKLIAGRSKDIQFVRDMIHHRYITVDDIQSIVHELEEEQKQRILSAIEHI